MREYRLISETRSVLSDIMLPHQANPSGNVHGGEIMKMMDTCGGVVAQRHARMNVVTVKVDELIFYKPICVGDYVTCTGEMVYVGSTSMTVRVTVKNENITDKNSQPQIALTAYFTFVALDENGKPTKVLPVIPETDEEKVAYDEFEKKYLAGKQERRK